MELDKQELQHARTRIMETDAIVSSPASTVVLANGNIVLVASKGRVVEGGGMHC